jgi:uncharacterized membrane protein YphA (DoxX/SURF4 family)
MKTRLLTLPGKVTVSQLAHKFLSFRVVRWFALLGLCSAYLVGGVTKAFDWPGALSEMRHFGLVPASVFAGATIILEIGAALMILVGVYRWVGALALAAFTFLATFLANRFWDVGGADRFAATNAFFEHLGLVGALVLIAWIDLNQTEDKQK